ncbi:MAG TPA: hypothetical protein VJZ00_02110 [Thermoanaerobaculia bacterium]|nr:hypothetical protein [Thermoanaerobaculia bacterium]
MTTTPVGDLNAASVIEMIASGAYPRDVIMTIARGFLPLAQEDLISVFAYLVQNGDEEIATAARASLSDIPMRAMFEFASNENIRGDLLIRLVGVTDDNLVLEALIRNRAVPDASICELARRADARVQEVIVINQARILRAPEILEALLENPELTPDARRRALETKEEFFEKKARLAQIEAEAEKEPLILDIDDDPIADLLERAAEEFGDEIVPTTAPIAEIDHVDENKAKTWARIQFMTVGEKVQLAFKGDRLVRMLLVRDRNKLICSAVMRNPRMTETEVESIAGMRNVDEEVLRLISMRRDWISKYNVMLTLCRNPKTPVGVVLPFINRLTLRDLKGMKDDKGVQQIVREMAKKTYMSRAPKT